MNIIIEVDDIIGIIINHPFVGFIIGLIGILVGILSLVFVFVFRPRKSAKYVLRGNSLVSKLTHKIEGLSVHFDGKNIESLVATKFVFWNTGNTTLHGNDFPENDKLSISANENIKIISISCLKDYMNSSNNISAILSSDTKVDISFEYLDKKEGVALELFHTGSSSNDLLLNGTIMNFGKVQKHRIEDFAFFTLKKYLLLFAYVVCFAGFLLLMAYSVFTVGGHSIFHSIPVAFFSGLVLLESNRFSNRVPLKFKKLFGI